MLMALVIMAGWAVVMLAMPVPYLLSRENWFGVAVAAVRGLLMLMVPPPVRLRARAKEVLVL